MCGLDSGSLQTVKERVTLVQGFHQHWPLYGLSGAMLLPRSSIGLPILCGNANQSSLNHVHLLSSFKSPGIWMAW